MGRNQPHRYNIQTPTQMAVIKTIEKGESLTFGFVLPETYNLANLQSIKVYIGSTVYTHTMVSRTARVELSSNETALLTGRNIVHFVIDDAVFGIKKINCGMLEVLPTQATHKDTSINTGYDVEVVLTIDIETVSVESVLYNVLQGPQGPQGIQGIQGPAGDFFIGQFKTVIDKLNLVWVDGWVHIDTGSKMNAKMVDVGYMAINTGQGTVQLTPIVHYPSATTDSSSTIPNGFYVKDNKNLLAENTDFETLDIRYNVSNDTISKYDGKAFRLEKENVAFDDYSESHSAAMAEIFMDIYPNFAGTVYRSAVDELTPSTRIDAYYEAEYARIRKLNIIAVPISNAATVESSGSNPDILKIAAHYDNTFTRHDITSGPTVFLRNVIAETSGPDVENRTTGCTFGNGVEFFEDNVKTSDVYPNYVYNAWNPIYQQSATSSIIMAKFKMIQDRSGANWHICRMAARATAEKTVGGVFAAGHPWDMYRGFGIINVDAAVQYIEDNYKSLEYRAMLADQHDGLNGISPFIEYADFLPDSPIPKRLIPAIFWDDEARTYYFDVPDGGQIQIGQEPHDYYTNLNGSQVVNGDIVSVVGASGNRTAIALTDVTNDASAMKCIGMVTVETIGNNNVGRITKSGGKVRGLNTAAYLEGDVLFVDPENAGKWTNVQPEAPIRCIRIGYVTVSHATEGVVELAIDIYQKFVDSCDVDGTPLTESGQLPVWDNTRKVFDFTENINDFKPIEYVPAIMTVQRGTLTQGTVADLAAVGGTDVIIQELSGADPLRVQFTFNDVRKVGFFSFYGRYNGGAMHIIWIEAYNNTTLAWDLLGELSNFTSKQWFGYNMFLAENYISESGVVLVRMNHQGNGINTHTLTLDYVDIHFGGGGGSSVRTATTINFIPTGNVSATNVQAAIVELDTEKANLATAMYKLVNDNTGYAHTGSTGYTTVKTVTIPANTLNADSVIWLDLIMSWTNNSNTKFFGIQFNTSYVLVVSKTTGAMIHYYIPFRLKAGKLIFAGESDGATLLFGTNSNTTSLTEVDFGGVASDININFRVNLGVASDTAKYESINVIIEK